MEVLTRDNHRSFMSLYEQAEKAIADKAGLLMLDVLACVMEAYVFSVVGTQKRLLLPAEEKLFDKMDPHRLLNILDCLSAVQEKKQLIQTLHFDVTQILINTLTSFKNCSTIETACR